jgi:hypothetical protein
VSITDAYLGLLIQKVTTAGAASQPDSQYALVAGGSAALVGIDGLTLTGSLAARVNRMGTPVDKTIDVQGTPVHVKFDSPTDVTEFSGSAQIAIANFVSLEGSFGFSKSGNSILVGAAGVRAFMGTTASNGPLGIEVTNGNLGLILKDGKYALTTGGNVALVGLDGLEISGGFNVKANKLGTPVNETITTPAGTVAVLFPTNATEMTFAGSATLKVAGAFAMSGSVEVTKNPSGVILVDIPEMSLSIASRGTNIIELGGRTRFGIGGGRGFQLLDFGLTQVSLMGTEVSVAAGALPSLTKPSMAPVAAQLTTIADGIDATLLNRRGYLDVTFESPGTAALDVSSILDAAPEFSLSGSGVADAVLDRVEQLEGNTFRYYYRDRNSNNEIGLFRPGNVSLSFNSGAWNDANGVFNTAATDSFTARDGRATTSRGVKLGPLVLNGPYFGIEDFSFAPIYKDGALDGALLTITVGLGVDEASLAFGSGSQESDSGFSSKVLGLLGLFDVRITLDVPDCLGSITSNPFACVENVGLGKFTISADEIDLKIAKVVEANAKGVVIGFDPVKDKDNDGEVSSQEQSDYDQQEILKVDSATVTIPKINVSGSVNPYTRKNGTRIPGLVVRNNGFHLGDAQLSYTAPISLGSFLELRDIRAGVTDFGITFGAGVDFNGQIYIASGGATLLPGKPISMEISDGPDADTEAVRAGLSFSNGIPSGFKFKADKLKMNFSSFITVTGEGIEIDSEAGPDENVAKFSSIGAEVKAGPLKISGRMRQFAVTGDGRFVTLPGFGLFLSVDEASPGAMKSYAGGISIRTQRTYH